MQHLHFGPSISVGNAAHADDSTSKIDNVWAALNKGKDYVLYYLAHNFYMMNKLHNLTTVGIATSWH